MRALIPCLPLVMLAVAPGCAHFASGSVNGISYYMSLDREGVPGGVPWSISILINEGEPDVGILTVDEVCYGEVRAGDHVEVTDEAVVLINGEERLPVSEEQRGAPSL